MGADGAGFGSQTGVLIGAIPLLAAHNQTAITELVYPHQIVPALTRGTEVMDQIFGQSRVPCESLLMRAN